MKQLISFFLLLSASLLSAQDKMHHVKILESNFNLYGKTNVNNFECSLHQEESNHDLNVSTHVEKNRLNFKGLRLNYPVSQFSCKLKAMDKDMQELLKSEEYPQLYLEIHNIEVDISTSQMEQVNVGADVSIEIAGVSQSYRIEDGEILNRSEEELTFKGSKLLKMTDFGIEPPTKFFGMVTVTNELKVAFEIALHVKTLND